jgi:fructosamine-3-kinase
MDLDAIYCPQPEIIQPFALAFTRMMFAHAGFEEEVRQLQGVVTNDPDFGEQRQNQWSAKQRPQRMAKLIEEHLGPIPEIEPIVQLLKQAIKTSHQRNVLAHGQWWRFNPKTSVMSVRSGTQWGDGRSRYTDYTEAEITTIAVTFAGLGAELYKLRRELEHNSIKVS